MTTFYIIEDFPKSEIEFDKRFATERACYDYLSKVKWPGGFVCAECGYQSCWISSKHIYICTRCERQFSLTADTIMHDTKKPITYWFRAMWWFTTRKSGVNAINLQDLLGCSYVTAWSWLQKLRQCTIRKDREKLSGKVEVDEFFIGGQKPGKRGRGAGGKCIVVAAVERDRVAKLAVSAFKSLMTALLILLMPLSIKTLKPAATWSPMAGKAIIPWTQTAMIIIKYFCQRTRIDSVVYPEYT